jgi:hypothetical protein
MTTWLSPDCRDENHQKCDRIAWDEDKDDGTDCGCDCHIQVVDAHPKDYLECWAKSKGATSKGWPEHEWAGDDHGHNCTGCADDSPWKCDRVGHRLGVEYRRISHADPS